MIGKIFLMAAVFFLTTFGNVSAQVVTVTGLGADRDSAIRDAAQNAVAEVVGVYISSQSVMENFVLQLDEIYEQSQGYVKSIKILSERRIDSSFYEVHAKVDVDTSPNGELIDKLTMIMQMSDPRIAVKVVAADQSTRDIFAESCLTEKLLSLGFNHVVSAENDDAIDYLVLGNYSLNSNAVLIPGFGDNRQSISTNFKNVSVALKVDIVKHDTGEIIGAFTVQGKDTNIHEEIAVQNAVAQASDLAAEKLSDVIKKFGSQPIQHLSFTITAENEQLLQQCIEEMRDIGAVKNLYVREIKGNRAVLAVDSVQKPNAIVSVLKGRTKLEVSIENLSAGSCSLKIISRGE